MNEKIFIFDPDNPPKYCPQCEVNGLKCKVKKFKRSIPEGQKVLIMCKNEKVSTYVNIF